MSNAEIASQLMSLAQLLSAQKENPFKVKAYRKAATTIRALPDSIEELARNNADLTAYPGIGKAIAGTIREIVQSGKSQQLETLRSAISPELAAISQYPRLDPARVLRIYKKLNIGSVAALEESLASGEIRRQLGGPMEQHVRQALTEPHEMLLPVAQDVVEAVTAFLLSRCGVSRAEVAGDYRRRVEVISQVSFLIETADFAAVISKMQKFGGGTQLLTSAARTAQFRLPSGAILSIETNDRNKWGIALLAATGSVEHLQKLDRRSPSLRQVASSKARYPNETAVYRKLGLAFIEPELREGLDEVELAASGTLPFLVTRADIRGELHAHSTSSDGAHAIEQMAGAAAALGYEYTGITDHSKSLKIAHGLSDEDLWKQLRYIDKLNAKGKGVLILKSAEVDILADGSLDYPDDLLKELDYTICSIHSKFALGKDEQTERILRAMDHRYFNILGHATGRKLLKRPGYEIDVERVMEHARSNGCFVEINSSPDRLDVSAGNARIARDTGVKVAITTDAHATREYDLLAYGIDQARRAGLQKESVLNARSWKELQRLFKR